MKIAIQGHPTRGKEIIQILRSLGATSYNTYDTCSYPKWYWYINKNREITCDPKRSMCGYKLYTLEEFEKEFPFKVGDKVIYDYTPNFVGTVVNIKFDDNIPYRVNINGTICTCGTNMLKLCKEMKEERNITLTLDKAKEWYKKGGELKEIALQAFSEKELNPLPRSWEEFATSHARMGYYISADGKPLMCASSGKLSSPHVCPSQKSAEAHLAMMQLEQLRNCWWDGWEPIWDRSEKWCIRLWGNAFDIGITTNISRFLTFPTKEMATEFLRCFKDLIDLARDLI